MFIIQDNLGNFCEAESRDAAATAAGQLFEDNPANCHTVTITKRADLEQIEKDFAGIVEQANQTMRWGH